MFSQEESLYIEVQGWSCGKGSIMKCLVPSAIAKICFQVLGLQDRRSASVLSVHMLGKSSRHCGNAHAYLARLDTHIQVCILG